MSIILIKFDFRFDVILVQDKHKLIVPMKDKNVVLYYVSDGKLYNLLKSTHISIGHGGRDRMIKELSKKYKNISRSDICTFLQMCETCQEKQKNIKKATVIKPIICSEFNSRCQVDLIEFQLISNEKFKYIMIYQDNLTKFIVLRPLKHKLVEEVAYNLIDIFTLLGAPCIIQSSHGRDFSNDVVNCLRGLWPELKIVHGKPNHSQENEEQVKQDVTNMLITWMQDQKSSDWSEGLRFIQLMKNRTYHSGIKMTSYEALFGTKIKVGLSEKMADNAALNIDSEEDLREFMEKNENINTKQNLSNSNSGNEEMISVIQLNNKNLNNMCEIAIENCKSQAKEIKKNLDKKCLPVEIGSVKLPVFKDNKEDRDCRNILPVIEVVFQKFITTYLLKIELLKQL